MGGQLQLVRGWLPITEATDDKPWTIDARKQRRRGDPFADRHGCSALHSEPGDHWTPVTRYVEARRR